MTPKEPLTPREALEHAKREQEVYTLKAQDRLFYRDFADFWDIVVNALERQMPKKPKDYDYVLPGYDECGYQCDVIFCYKAKCPACDSVLCDGDLEKSDMEDFTKFCPMCGQAIDWTEDNE